MKRPIMAIGQPPRRLAWAVWILVSVAAAAVGALAAWGIRSFPGVSIPPSLSDFLAYTATITSAVIVSASQWFVLNRYRLTVSWWVPATVAATLAVDIIVIPSVLHLFLSPFGTSTVGAAILAGGAALAVAGVVVGTAQALVLRVAIANAAWLWIPATVIGEGLAGALTTAASTHLLGLPGFAVLSLVAAVGSLLTAAAQAPVLLRLLR